MFGLNGKEHYSDREYITHNAASVIEKRLIPQSKDCVSGGISPFKNLSKSPVF